jgi:hypothetical protein
VEALARVSLANRDLTFPNTREAGLDSGKGIAEDCKGDPQALLFPIVDKHVRRVARPRLAPAADGAGARRGGLGRRLPRP